MQTDDKQIEIWYNTVAIGTIADMADVAQLVRALDCGSGGRGFKSHHSPHRKHFSLVGVFSCYTSCMPR